MAFPVVADEALDESLPLNQYGVHSNNPYAVERFIYNGEVIEKAIVPGPPTPPEGFAREFVAELPASNQAAGVNILSDVPASTWAFGCSATSASMMFGYYDRTGYPNMYTGPTNGGVFPLTNATWGTVTINGESRALNPLSATRNGLDGRAIYGHVDDYWIKYGSSDQDPFIGNWTEHTKGECTGDYMGTNQSQLGNTDGSTSFYYNPSGSPLCDYNSAADGTHGMKLFVQSRGYTVQAGGNCYQLIQGSSDCSPACPSTGFTYANFKSEIDAGRPVLIQLAGHTMLGFGYSDPSTIYVHDTWGYTDHTMTWGGSYSGMQHTGVTVLKLTVATPAVTTDDVIVSGATTATGGGDITCNGGTTVLSKGVCWGTSSNPTISGTCTNDGTNLGPFTSSLTGLSAGTAYHARAYATTSASTSYGRDVSFFSLCGSPTAKINSTPYASISQAILNATPGAAIETNTASFPEQISFSQTADITFQGGYDCTFNTIPSMSNVQKVTLGGANTGSVTIAGLVIQ